MSINIKNNKAPNPKIMVQRNPHSAPAVMANARQMAESMVKSTLNFKNIALFLLVRLKKCLTVYNIYNIVHARARDVKEKWAYERLKINGKRFFKKVKKSLKKYKKTFDKSFSK